MGLFGKLLSRAGGDDAKPASAPRNDKTFRLLVAASGDDMRSPPRASVGGHPVLPRDVDWPRCQICNEFLVLYLQFDLVKALGLPLAADSHLSIFACRQHDAPPGTPYTQTGAVNARHNGSLPSRFWTKDDGHFFIYLAPPMTKAQEHVFGRERRIKHRTLDVRPGIELFQATKFESGKSCDRGTRGFKIGGEPHWTIQPQTPQCCCGAPMVFVCQIPGRMAFRGVDAQKQQPHSPVENSYFLFGGMQAAIFACSQQCDPQAIVAVTMPPAAADAAAPGSTSSSVDLDASR